MDVVKLQKFKEGNGCYFLDAGDVKIIPSKSWRGITVESKNGTSLFEMGMNPAYATAFGFVIVDILNREHFELPTEIKPETILLINSVSCFDSRIVAYVILMDSLRGEVFKYREKVKDITLPMLTTEEAKSFLRENNLLQERPDPEWKPDPPNKLVGIPDKIQKLFE